MEAYFPGINETGNVSYSWPNTTIGYLNGTDSFSFDQSNKSSGGEKRNQESSFHTPEAIIILNILCVLGMLGNPVAFLVWHKENGFKPGIFFFKSLAVADFFYSINHFVFKQNFVK